MLTAVTITRLEKAATDNGFDLDLERTADWLSFGSSQTSMRIGLTAIGESQFLAATSRADVLDGLAGLGVVFTNPLPSGAAGARSVSDVAALHRLLRRAFQLSRTLPDALLRVFEDETSNLAALDVASGEVMTQFSIITRQAIRQGGRAVPLVVVRNAFHVAQAQGQHRLASFQRLDLALLVHAQDQGVLRGMQVQAGDIPYFVNQKRDRWTA